MQDAICPTCGAIFRTRAHSKHCVDAGGYDQRFLELALEVQKDQIIDHLKLRLQKLTGDE